MQEKLENLPSSAAAPGPVEAAVIGPMKSTVAKKTLHATLFMFGYRVVFQFEFFLF